MWGTIMKYYAPKDNANNAIKIPTQLFRFQNSVTPGKLYYYQVNNKQIFMSLNLINFNFFLFIIITYLFKHFAEFQLNT